MRISALLSQLSLSFAALSLAACAAAPPRLPIAVLVRAPEAEIAPIRASLGGEGAQGVEVRFVELPATSALAAKSGDVEARLAAARKAYTVPDVPACLAALGGDEVVPDLLAEGRRAEAARVLFWRVACHVAAASLPDAQRAADDFAAYALDVPPEVEAASPEAEAVLGRSLAQVSARPAAHLALTAGKRAATVAIDGRPALCVTPCRVDLRPGPHLLVLTEDGAGPERRSIVLPEGDTKLDVPMNDAPPDLAASQWSSHYGAGGEIDSAGSLRLLAQAVRARNLVLLAVEDAAPGARLRGAITVSGDTRARAERALAARSDAPAAAAPLLDELLREGKLVVSPALWKRPLFWGIVGLAAATAAVVTYAVLYKPPVTTEVRF
jgi:hypothetical protein